jgi:putative GTP pyrophosphokinase
MGTQARQKHVHRLLRIYGRHLPRYKRMRKQAEGLVRSILPMQFVHSVQSRVKKPKSLANKIVGRKYSSFDQITDIVGVRVITNFSDDADRIAERLREEFSIDERNSIDKSTVLDPDQFGYLSLQLIARIKQKRKALREYRDFRNDPFEIQIRSILQHAWAEIEHDRGYKSVDKIPREVKRRFARLAALLELGDSEFVEIRDRVNAINAHMNRLTVSPNSPIRIDKNSLAIFIARSPIVRRIDRAVARSAKVPLISSDTFVELNVSRLRAVGFETLGEVEKAIRQKSVPVRNFLSVWFSTKRGKSHVLVPQGMSLSFLSWMKALDDGGRTGIEKILARHAFRRKSVKPSKLANELHAAYEKSKRLGLHGKSPVRMQQANKKFSKE